MEKSWLGTSYLNSYTDKGGALTTTFGSILAFNPKLSLGLKVLNQNETNPPIEFAFSTKIYIETRGSKMYRQ